MKLVVAFLSILWMFAVSAEESFMPWTEVMKRADTDTDGVVSMNEVKEFSHTKEFIGFQPFMADHFMDLDTNSDDMISNEELKTGIMKLGMTEDEVSKGFQEGFSFMPKD